MSDLYPPVDCTGKKSDESPGTIGIHRLSRCMTRFPRSAAGGRSEELVKLRTHLQRLLLLVGFALLAFYAAARLHEVILSRAGMRHFEDQRATRLNQSAVEKRVVHT